MLEEIITLENMIRQLKTEQATGADSFRYYFYGSGNVYADASSQGFSYKKKLTFIPKVGNKGDYICKFFCFSPGTKLMLRLHPYPKNYNQAFVDVSQYGGTATVADLEFAYFGCITTAQGDLIIEDTDEGDN